MIFWSTFFLLMAIGYFLTDTYLSFRNKKTVSVRIIKKDGSVEEGVITLGRDAKADKLINKLKAEQKAKCS